MKIVIQRTVPLENETTVAVDMVVLGQTLRRRIDPHLEVKTATGTTHFTRYCAIVGFAAGLVGAGHEVYTKVGKYGRERPFVVVSPHCLPWYYYYFGIALGGDHWEQTVQQLREHRPGRRWEVYRGFARSYQLFYGMPSTVSWL